jgi:hypothetical protein
VVIDLFSRALLGWKLSASLHVDLIVGATTRAIERVSCPEEQSFTPIAAASTPPLSPASCSRDMACVKASLKVIVMTTLFLKAPLLP